jgi:hypothetical protein
MYGDRAPGFGNSNFDNLAQGGYYGAGRFGYSRNEFSASGVSASAVTQITTGSNFYEINFDSNYINSCNAGEIYKVVIPNVQINAQAIAQGVASGYTTASVDTFGVQAFYLVAPTASIAATSILADYTTITNIATTFYVSASSTFNDGAGRLLSGSTVNVATRVVLFKQGSLKPINVGDYEAGGNPLASPNVQSYSDIEFPELNIKLTSDSITAETRKLKAQWTPEFAQDLNAYQNFIDVSTKEGLTLLSNATDRFDCPLKGDHHISLYPGGHDYQKLKDTLLCCSQ